MLNKLRYRFEIFRVINKFAFGVRKHFFLILFSSGACLVTSLSIPIFYKLFIDQVIICKSIKVFTYVVSGYLSLFLLGTAFSFMRNYSSNRLINRIVFRVKHKILSNYLEIPSEEFEKRDTGDLKMRIDDDVLKIADFVGKQTVDYIISIITVIISSNIILSIEWRLALFSILVIPLTVYFDHKISLKEKELQDTNRVNDQKLNSWLHASIQGWKEVKALNLQRHQLKTFVRYIHNFAEFFGRWINYWVLRILIIPKIKDEFLMKFALYFFGGLLIIRGDISIGELLVFGVYYDMFSKNIRMASLTDAEFQRNIPFYDRVLEELRSKVESQIGEKLPITGNGCICMKNVSFAYDNDTRMVVNNFHMDIKQGEHVAIIGKSGCGKTTILKLIMGMLSPRTGEIYYSGINLKHINRNDLYGKVGFIMQENLLFNSTISENLRLACANAKIDALDNACKNACIYDFINGLPNGYDTIIGEKGLKLSGGQRQRLVLARMFLRDVDVMIFDEATSSLDRYSESIIQDAISAIGKDKTIIVVTHREASIGLFDRVIRLG